MDGGGSTFISSSYCHIYSILTGRIKVDIHKMENEWKQPGRPLLLPSSMVIEVAVGKRYKYCKT